MNPKILGKRLHIAGSIPENASPRIAEYSHSLVRSVANTFLSNAGGLVVTVGPELFLKESKIPTIFDWTILETVDECEEYPNKKWPSSQGSPVVAVAFEKYSTKIPAHRQELWKRLLTKNKVDLQLIPSELSVGGIMRQRQSKYGDILLTVGGYLGVYHLAQLYQASHKPVIPLDLSFNSQISTASEVLAHHVTKDARDFFDFNPNSNAITSYSKLSLKIELTNEEKFSIVLLDFIDNLPKPLAFYVRLLDKKNPDFKVVENYFRNVIDRVVEKMGYQRFEMETDFSDNIFMNVELFEKLHYSSLVIVDLTGVRPNCCLELGYALGLEKKFILMALEGTMIPWDTSAIHCHFWNIADEDKIRKKRVSEFIEKNINKNPIVS